MSQVDDLSYLPKPGKEETPEGWPPDRAPRFAPHLVHHFADAATGRELASPEARFRHSNAGACSRAVAYAALRIEQSNPPDAPGHYVMAMGQWLHDRLQEVILDRFQAEAEVKVTLEGGEMAGHVDLEVTDTVEDTVEVGTDSNPDVAPVLISIEAKSVGGYAYKVAVGERGPAMGPKYDHLIQASLNAKARDAHEAVVLYLARDAISIQAAGRKKMDDMTRVVAEWTLTREQYTVIADKEIGRINAILRFLDNGLLPSRKIPDPDLPLGHVIVNPRKGTWASFDAYGVPLDGGDYWACLYCGWQDICVRTDPGRTPVSQLVEIGVLDAS